MPTGLSKITMFVSSMAPLLIVFALLDTFGDPTAALACVVVALVSVLGHGLLFWSLSRGRLGSASKAREYMLSNAEERGGDVMAYVATYLIPFAGFTADDWRSAAALGVFLLVIGALYVRSGLYAINPCLAMIGFHLYNAEVRNSDKETRPTSLLTRTTIPPGSVVVNGHQLGSDLIIAFKKDVRRGHPA